LNEVQQRVLDGLQADGIAVIRFTELLDDMLWSELEADIALFIAENEAMLGSLGDAPESKEEFIIRRFYVKGKNAKGKKDQQDAFTLDSPWLRLALSEEILDVVDSYRDQLITLYYFDNWFTPPFGGADERVASQRWHRDPEEEHVVKVFVYFSDVAEGTGPFEYVKGSPTGKRYGDLLPWADGKSSRHPHEEQIVEATAPEDRVTLTGPRGTMIFCDTSGFHRGGFARTKPRVMYASTYVSPAAKQRKPSRFRVELGGRESELSPRALAALD
jgi:hypothetical protein